MFLGDPSFTLSSLPRPAMGLANSLLQRLSSTGALSFA
jgi:hypothetical protein